MPNWNIIAVIKSIYSQNEADIFRFWLEERSATKESYPLLLFNVLMEATKAETVDTLSPETCWEKLRPGDDYDDNLLRQYRSQLIEKAKAFFMEQAMEEEKDLVRLMEFRQYAKRGLSDLLEKAYNKQIRDWKDVQILDPADLQFLYTADQLRNQARVKQNQPAKSLLPAVIERFETYTQTHYMHLLSALASLRELVKLEYEAPNEKVFLDIMASQYPQPGEDLTYIYYFLYQFQKKSGLEVEDKQGVDHILHLLRPGNHTLHPNELGDIALLLLNGVINRMNGGAFELWAPIYLNLCRWGITNGSFLEEGALDPRFYKNMVVSSLRLEFYEEAQRLIRDLKHYLGEEGHEYQRFCQAYLYYSQRDYTKMRGEDAFSPLHPFKNPHLLIESEIIKMQAMYEQHWVTGYEKEADELKDEIKKLRRKITGLKKVLKERQTDLFAERLNKFNKLLKPLTGKKLEEFEAEILNAPNLSNQAWFLNQIAFRKD